MGGPAERRGDDRPARSRPRRCWSPSKASTPTSRSPASRCTSRSTARPRSGRWSSSSSATASRPTTISDLKGAKLMTAPGPANFNTAKAVLAKNGLKDGDYTIDQLDMSQHVNAMTAGTFDGGYTLEPNASMMIKAGVARSLEVGVISKYILGDEKADAYAAGCAITSEFIQKRPEVAKRFADGLGQGDRLHQQEPGRRAQVSRQEHLHARQRRRYGLDARLHHGQGHDARSRSATCRSCRTSAPRSGSFPKSSTSPKFCYKY